MEIYRGTINRKREDYMYIYVKGSARVLPGNKKALLETRK